jgi:DNA-binding XRE family transcriptional regulator
MAVTSPKVRDIGGTRQMFYSAALSIDRTTPLLAGTSVSKEDANLCELFKLPVVSVPFLNRDIGSRFGVRLRDLRRSHGLTQLDMAVTFGIDRTYISDVECGKKGISLATLEIIALGFSMNLSQLLADL